MTDQAYQNALKRRERLQKELQEIDEFLRLYQRFSGTEPEQNEVRRWADYQPDFIFSKEPGDTRVVDAKTYVGRNPSRQKVAKIARELMLERGKPMTRGDLVDAFKAIGRPISGVDPSKNMGTVMWRLRDQFINIEGHGYWPKDTPCEEVGYNPATAPGGEGQ